MLACSRASSALPAAGTADSNVVRQALWIFAASQLLALVLVLFAVVVKWLVIVGLVVFAVVGLAILSSTAA